MRSRHSRTLHAIQSDPVRTNIHWRDVEALLVTVGAEISEGRGSRIRVALHGVKAVLHRPHPEKELSKAMVRSVREFLSNAGVG
jgi:hypothetical protein